MNTEIPTPRTDAEFARYPILDTQRHGDAVPIDFARNLEREICRFIDRTAEWFGGCGHCAEIFFTGGANMNREHQGCDAARIIALRDTCDEQSKIIMEVANERDAWKAAWNAQGRQHAVLHKALERIATYDEQSIWMDDRDDSANDMLEIARKALVGEEAEEV